MWRNVELEECLNDPRRDRIVTAAGAQGGDRALVVAARESERVLRQIGMVELRFGELGHRLSVAGFLAPDRRDIEQLRLLGDLVREQQLELRVAILLDDEDMLMGFDEFGNLVGERKAADAHPVEVDALRLE